MLQTIKNFLADESGATAVEYALIAMIVAIGMVESFTAASTALGDSLENTAEAIPQY